MPVGSLSIDVQKNNFQRIERFSKPFSQKSFNNNKLQKLSEPLIDQTCSKQTFNFSASTGT
jgi:hypothetical protein